MLLGEDGSRIGTKARHVLGHFVQESRDFFTADKLISKGCRELSSQICGHLSMKMIGIDYNPLNEEGGHEFMQKKANMSGVRYGMTYLHSST